MNDRFDPKNFIRDLLNIEMPDGADVEDLAIKYGITELRSLSEDEIADEDGPWHEYGCEEGDGWLFITDAYKAWLDDKRKV